MYMIGFNIYNFFDAEGTGVSYKCNGFDLPMER